MREPPMLIPAGACVDEDANPVFIPPLPYGKVFETLLHVLPDYDFEIANSHDKSVAYALVKRRQTVMSALRSCEGRRECHPHCAHHLMAPILS